MTNKLRTLLAFSAIGMSFAALPAIAGEPLHVNVPFAFTAGKTSMPAGEYTVYENEAHLVLIRGAKSSVMVLGTPGSDSQGGGNSLGFERTSNGGFSLRSIHAVGQPSSVLPVVKGEK
jgi:hypothetical protein